MKTLSFLNKKSRKTRFFVKILMTFACLGIAGCAIPNDPTTPTHSPEPSPTDPTPLLAENGAWVSMLPATAEEFQVATWASPSGTFSDYWMPGPDDIAALEGQLGAYLQTHATQFFGHPTVWEQLDEYHRQYVGLVVDGKPLIYGNFFCTETETDWLNEWVIVLDGGDCFFQVTFDVEGQMFIRLQVNGES